MGEIRDWFTSNKLVINKGKSVWMNFHSIHSNKNSTFSSAVKLDNHVLSHVQQINFLGLNIQENLSWESHITKITQTLNRSSFAIRILKPVTNAQTLRSIYFASFHSIMRYGIIFWGNSSHAQSLFKLQKRVIRVMVDAKYLESCKPIFKEHKILPLPSLYVYEILLYVRKQKHLFIQNNEFHNHNTRQKEDLHVLHHSTALYKNGVLNSGIRLYNNLPKTLKELKTFVGFKRKVKEFLELHCFYSVEEYMALKSVN